MVWILAISAATTRRATSKSSSARDVAVADDLRRVAPDCAGRNRRPACCAACAAELVDEQVVLAREDVVKEAQPDRPVVGEGGRLLAGPLRDGSDRTLSSTRQIALALARRPRAGRWRPSAAWPDRSGRASRGGASARRSRRSARRPTTPCSCCAWSLGARSGTSRRRAVNVAGRRRRRSAPRRSRRPGGSRASRRRRGSGVSTSFTVCDAQPTVMICAASLCPSSRCENQSCVMNWIQNAASTLKNGAFL